MLAVCADQPKIKALSTAVVERLGYSMKEKSNCCDKDNIHCVRGFQEQRRCGRQSKASDFESNRFGTVAEPKWNECLCKKAENNSVDAFPGMPTEESTDSASEYDVIV